MRFWIRHVVRDLGFPLAGEERKQVAHHSPEEIKTQAEAAFEEAEDGAAGAHPGAWPLGTVRTHVMGRRGMVSGVPVSARGTMTSSMARAGRE